MISIFKDEPVKDHPEFFVLSPSGDYAEVDLIECYHQDNPGVPICAFSAQCVKYGDSVYQQADPLNENQVAALEVNAPMEEVLNNEDLIDGKVDPMDLSVDIEDADNRGLGTPAEDFKPKVPKNLNEYVPASSVETPEPVVAPDVSSEVISDPQVGDVVGEDR